MFEKRPIKEEILREIYTNGVLNALLKKSLFDTCTSNKRTALKAMLQLSGYQTLVSIFWCQLIPSEVWKGTSPSKIESDQKGGSSKKLVMVWCSTCADISLLRLKDRECKEYEIVKEDRSSFAEWGTCCSSFFHIRQYSTVHHISEYSLLTGLARIYGLQA